MNKPSKLPAVGDTITIDIHKPHRGTFPIGKLGNLVCRLYIPKSVGRINPGDTCLAEVEEIASSKNKFLKVRVKEVIKTAAANNFELLQKLKNVKVEDQTNLKRKKHYSLAEAFEKASTKIK